VLKTFFIPAISQYI